MMDGDGLTNVLWLERKSRPWGMEKSGLVTLVQYLDSSDEGKGFVQFSVLVVILSLWNPHYEHYCDLLWASQVALVVKNLPANEGDTRDAGSIPGSGRSPGRGHGNTLQYSCLENAMDRGAWKPTVHGVTQRRTWLKWLSSSMTCSDLWPIRDSLEYRIL